MTDRYRAPVVRGELLSDSSDTLDLSGQRGKYFLRVPPVVTIVRLVADEPLPDWTSVLAESLEPVAGGVQCISGTDITRSISVTPSGSDRLELLP